MSKVKARAVLVDGKPYQKKADGSLVPLKGKTDWKRLDRMTSTQVEAIAASDRDGAPMTDAEWAKAEIVHPHKVAVGLKLDDDLLGWFKSQGKGYQTRINSILRRYSRRIVRLVSESYRRFQRWPKRGELYPRHPRRPCCRVDGAGADRGSVDLAAGSIAPPF